MSVRRVLRAYADAQASIGAEGRRVAGLVQAELIAHDARVAGLYRIPKRERPLCGARTRAGGTCQARAVLGGERCRLHGGVSQEGRRAEALERLQAQRRELLHWLDVARALGRWG